MSVFTADEAELATEPDRPASLKGSATTTALSEAAASAIASVASSACETSSETAASRGSTPEAAISEVTVCGKTATVTATEPALRGPSHAHVTASVMSGHLPFVRVIPVPPAAEERQLACCLLLYALRELLLLPVQLPEISLRSLAQTSMLKASKARKLVRKMPCSEMNSKC